MAHKKGDNVLPPCLDGAVKASQPRQPSSDLVPRQHKKATVPFDALFSRRVHLFLYGNIISARLATQQNVFGTISDLCAVVVADGNESPLVEKLVLLEAGVPLCFDEYRPKQHIAVPSHYVDIRLDMMAFSLGSGEMRPESNADIGRFPT
ncbi:MAG: hypothetical protein OXF11_14275 [Deltaproteobacteria bacterium]|nr:hypothetical protein [Deltaproteobacteria bacterium]